MQCSMAWALHRTEKEKPAAGKTDYWRDFWRSGWDSNPRNLAVQLISSQSSYDHFDTAPYLSQHQHLGKRGELMGRTSKNIKLRIPEKLHKIKGFRSGSYRVATTISSQGRYNHFDTTPYELALVLYQQARAKSRGFLRKLRECFLRCGNASCFCCKRCLHSQRTFFGKMSEISVANSHFRCYSRQASRACAARI